MGDRSDVEKEDHQSLVDGSKFRKSIVPTGLYFNWIERCFGKALPYLVGTLCIVVGFILLPLVVSNHKQISTKVVHDSQTTTTTTTTTTTRLGKQFNVKRLLELGI